GTASPLPLSSGVSLSDTPGLDSDKPSRNVRGLTLRVVRLRHLAVVERLVEGLLVDAGLAGHLAERTARARGLLDDLGRLVVADVRVQRRRSGERQLRVALAGLAVGLDPLDAALGEEARGAREELDRVQEVPREQ